MKRIIAVIVMVTLVGLTAFAQRNTRDSVRKVEYHLGLETGVAAGWGKGLGYTGVAPQLSYRFNDRFKLTAGAKVMSSYGLGQSNLSLSRTGGRSLVPRKASATVGYEVYARGEWAVNERLTLAATVMRMGGGVEWLWCDGPMKLDVTGVAADLRYRTRRGSMLGLHFEYIHDGTGALAPYMMWPYSYGPLMGDGFGGFGGYGCYGGLLGGGWGIMSPDF